MRRPAILEFLKQNQHLTGNKVKIRSKRFEDTVNEYNWRKDAELARLDASTPINSTLQEYVNWTAGGFSQFDDSCILAVETLDGIHIGNCGCFNIDEYAGEMELGIMIGDKNYWDKGYGRDVVSTLVTALFNSTDVQRIYLKTLDWNLRAQKCFNKCGFEYCGMLNRGEYNFIIMAISRQQLAGTV